MEKRIAITKKIHTAQPHVILSVLRVSGKQEGFLTHSAIFRPATHTGELPLPGIGNINEFFSTSRSAPAFMMIGFVLVGGLDFVLRGDESDACSVRFPPPPSHHPVHF